MSEAIEAFLDGHLPLPGVAACSVRLPDRTCVTRCYDAGFNSAQVEQALDRLSATADSLRQQGVQPGRLCWVFDRCRVYLALHRDGGFLACFAENRPGATNTTLENLLESFIALPTLATATAGSTTRQPKTRH
ncbi:MAG TPA: hypothetical protein P5205_07160 [Candidatus Paceibacterota bacterium]|nr:hypothetical protein [Verrucomicrobiota bacterium]HSA10136.1 hypothetical protein [Candidatus Paceibacterota bacterium]